MYFSWHLIKFSFLTEILYVTYQSVFPFGQKSKNISVEQISYKAESFLMNLMGQLNTPQVHNNNKIIISLKTIQL